MICDFRPLKLEKYRVRLTVGGDRLDYLGNQSSYAHNLVTYDISYGVLCTLYDIIVLGNNK